MTPSLIQTHYHTCNVGPNTVVKEEPNGNVTIELGYGHKFAGNRREDFENLRAACDRALAFFPVHEVKEG